MKVNESILILAPLFSYFVIGDQPEQVLSERKSAGGGAQVGFGGELVCDVSLCNVLAISEQKTPT